MDRKGLRQRVLHAAEAALADHQYVSPIDVLTGMGLPADTHVREWRTGRIDFLEEVIQGSSEKISYAMAAFRQWAQAAGLRPGETRYVRSTPGGTQDLQFSASGDPPTESFFRTHYVSPELSEGKREKLRERLQKAPEIVVFQVIRDSRCSECSVELPRDSLLTMEKDKPLCLPCSHLDDLEYLPAGDAALTRRATKYTERKAVVVRFSTTRKRYERQGILVEKAALERAERECAEQVSDPRAGKPRRHSAAKS